MSRRRRPRSVAVGPVTRTGGSVERWATNRPTPTARKAAAASGPAWAKAIVLRTTDSAGPVMKVSSSATDSKA